MEVGILWQAKQTKAIASVLEAVRGGHPSVLWVTGDPGSGKTSFLREVARLAVGFSVIEAEGREAAFREPFGVLQHLGVDDVLTAAGTLKAPVVAAHALREMVDRLSETGPVLVVVDDIQWADRESVEALYWLFQRAQGDRLLVVIASRTETDNADDATARLMNRATETSIVRLEGLTSRQTLSLVRNHDRAADEAGVERLREHTGGNPFHLENLLRQYGYAELSGMTDLPAPAQLADRTRDVLANLEPESASLLQASAVLGYHWVDLPTLTAVAGVEDPNSARQELLDAGLLVARSEDPGASLRTQHTLMRAAVYQATPYPRRRELHLSAAATLADSMAVLQHRVAATDRYDDALADELDAVAASAHAAGSYAQAAHVLGWSSALTTDPATRNRRWLDSVFDLLLARDMTAVAQQLPQVASAPDAARRALVRGLFLTIEKRWLDALAAYSTATQDDIDATDSLTRYRLLILTAWSLVGVGRSLESAADLLARASAEPEKDGTLIGYLIFATGMAALRRKDITALQEAFTAVPAIAGETPGPLTYKLAWRGSVNAFWGYGAAAEQDLHEVTVRFRGGVGDNGDGVYNGLLAFARWQTGAWNLANVEMRIALDSAIGLAHPMNRAIEPMLHVVRGDFTLADKLLVEVEDVLRLMPWREAVHLYAISHTVRLHAGSDPATRKAGLQRLRAVLGDEVLDVPGFTGAIWPLHMSLLCIWADEHELAERFIAVSEQMPIRPAWGDWAFAWLRALLAENRGDPSSAASGLDCAIDAFTGDLPLYRAHVRADRARLAGLLGDPEAARFHSAAASDGYQALGAAPYILHPSSGKDSEAAAPDVLFNLSDRERDVATLLISGLSYAQIARDLFVTRATVGFHLTRIYAKTGVASRHELTDLLRGNGF